MVVAKIAGWALALFLGMADPFSFEYAGQTTPTGQAHLVVRANEDVSDLEIVIKGDGKTITKSVRSLGRGKTYKVTWEQASAQAEYQLEVKAKGMEANFAFEIAKAAPAGKVGKLKVKSSREDIVKRRQATYETSFDLTSYEFKVYDSDGDVVGSGLVTEPVKAGQEFTVKWSSDAEVFMIYVRGEDQLGRFTEYKLVPWSVEIPHTEINFDSGKWDIKNDEAPKLDEAVAVAFHELEALEKVNEAVNANITPQLYIVGYTDTVGSAAANQKLSQSRAKAIAEYFRDKGFWSAIYYAGMGERGLRVQTDDNVDEVRNRRALYLIGVQPPAGGGAIPSNWTKLTGARARPAGFELPPLPEKWASYREERRRGNSGGESGEPSMENELPTNENATADPSGDRTPVSMPDGANGDDGPPPVEGEPGASKKGCSVDPDAPVDPRWALGWVVLLALGRRRRALA